MDHHAVLAAATEAEVCTLAANILGDPPLGEVRLLSGPQSGMVMLRVQESVADSQFNAGEVLVTQVRLEFDGQIGFATVLGDAPRRALAVALIDAALRRGDEQADSLAAALADLDMRIRKRQRTMNRLVAKTAVDFETF
jgi:alpha-D-ribose 1-methylphosphonate 5-triphosphate synthase subunit PhnG